MRSTRERIFLLSSLVCIAMGIALLVLTWEEPGRSPPDDGGQMSHADSPAAPATSPPDSSRPERILIVPDSPEERCLDALRLYTLDVDAVCVNLDYHLNWLSDDQEQLRAAGRDAAERWGKLAAEIERLEVPAACRDAHQAFSGLMEGLMALAEGTQGPEADLQGLVSAVADLWVSHNGRMRLLEVDFVWPDSPLDEAKPSFPNQEDSQGYGQAMELLDAGQYRQARATFDALSRKCPDNEIVLVRLADCLAQVTFGEDARQDEMTGGDPEESALKALEQAVACRRYSPVLFEAFLKWRALTQMHRHGASNYSDIPNGEYNAVRRRFVGQVRSRLAVNPDDVWARAQKELLLIWPNLQRGGMMGNSALTEWGLLFAEDVLVDVLQHAKEQSLREGQ